MYEKGEIVWSKIKGFPWWPAIIAKIIETNDFLNYSEFKSNEYLVNFIGDNSHAQVLGEKLRKFEENLKVFSANIKQKKLLQSIDIAKKIIKGDTTYDRERDRLASLLARKNKIQKAKKKRIALSMASKEQNEEINEGINSEYEMNLKNNNEKQFNSSTTLLFLQDQKKFNDMNKSEKTKKNDLPNIVKKQMKFESTEMENEDQQDKDIPSWLNENILFKRTKQNNTLKLLSDDEDKNYKSKIKVEGEKTAEEQDKNLESSKNNLTLLELEKKCKLGLEKMIEFSKINEGQQVYLEEINQIVKECSSYFDNVMYQTANNENLILETVNKNVGKYIHMLIKLIEENNHFIKNLMFLNSTVKKLQKMEDDLKKKLISKFFDFDDILNDYKTETGANLKIFENLNRKISEESVFSLNFNSEISKSDKYCSPMRAENFSISSEYSSKLRNLPELKKLAKKPSKIQKKIIKKAKLSEKTIKELNYEIEANKEKDQDKGVSNPKLRKKVCIKIYQLLERYYEIAKKEAHMLSLNMESKIRNRYPDMKREYMDLSMILLKSLKQKKIKFEILSRIEELNFNELYSILCRDEILENENSLSQTLTDPINS